MFQAMLPLPIAPTFPVFGLADAFMGMRWLMLWQRADGPWSGELTEVSLAYGRPEEGPFVVVHTIVKRDARRLGDDAWVGPVGVGYAAAGAIAHAISQEISDWRHAADTTRHELDLIAETEDGGAVLDGWTRQSIRVDDVDRAGFARAVGGASLAAVVELPTVVVGVSGPSEKLASVKIGDVSSELGAYLAGVDQNATSLLA